MIILYIDKTNGVVINHSTSDILSLEGNGFVLGGLKYAFSIHRVEVLRYKDTDLEAEGVSVVPDDLGVMTHTFNADVLTFSLR